MFSYAYNSDMSIWRKNSRKWNVMKCRISRLILTEKYFLIFWKTNILIFFSRENVNIFQFLDSFTKFLVNGHIPKNDL